MRTINRVPITKTLMSLTSVIMQGILTVINVNATVILPKIGFEILVPKAFLVIRDHSNINNPGKWLTSNVCFISPRYTDILLYIICILTK